VGGRERIVRPRRSPFGSWMDGWMDGWICPRQRTGWGTKYPVRLSEHWAESGKSFCLPVDSARTRFIGGRHAQAAGCRQAGSDRERAFVAGAAGPQGKRVASRVKAASVRVGDSPHSGYRLLITQRARAHSRVSYPSCCQLGFQAREFLT
jgi:hypothetical protein